jgi:hypothetical protein
VSVQVPVEKCQDVQRPDCIQVPEVIVKEVCGDPDASRFLGADSDASRALGADSDATRILATGQKN